MAGKSPYTREFKLALIAQIDSAASYFSKCDAANIASG